MKLLLSIICLLFYSLSASAQVKLRPLEELINRTDPGWPFVQQMIDSAKNAVEVLPRDSSKIEEALYQTQVTTRSPMGAVIYTTGGILVDGGWIRILGSGHSKLTRTVPSWNKGKAFVDFGDKASYLLIADDAVGGFFALNGGKFGKDVGNIYYLSPDRLIWEPLEFTYTQFLAFCFSGELDEFYGKLRWTNWKKDVAKLNGNSVFNFHPVLWSKEGKDINRNKRKKIAVGEQYEFNMSSRRQLGLEKENVQ
jgi:hypothetical protein